ncbi:MAG: serine/threonine protein kinase [Myxococcales bacterium]|nr:serine/threonine protein kinase [Myxococcales bacterium]
MHRLCPHCHLRFGGDLERCPDDGAALRDDPFIGAQVGQWTILDFVGQGAMGVVYRARPDAAIKILNAHRAAMQPDLIRRFEIEAEAATRLTSPHVARVFASGTTDGGHLYIAMELLRGAPLDAILARSARLLPATAAAITYQVAGALAEAHDKRIIHRDLKPANIFVEPAPGGGRHVRVLDFGVARINTEGVTRTRTGVVAGTPAYMSPEQLRGEQVDGRTDIYSLGVVLYRMLGGTNPFRGSGSIMQAMRLHAELTPPPLPVDVPARLAELVMHMLQKSPADRPQTMRTVCSRLEATGLVDLGADHTASELDLTLIDAPADVSDPVETWVLGDSDIADPTTEDRPLPPAAPEESIYTLDGADAQLIAEEPAPPLLTQTTRLPRAPSRWSWSLRVVLVALAVGGTLTALSALVLLGRATSEVPAAPEAAAGSGGGGAVAGAALAAVTGDGIAGGGIAADGIQADGIAGSDTAGIDTAGDGVGGSDSAGDGIAGDATAADGITPGGGAAVTADERATPTPRPAPSRQAPSPRRPIAAERHRRAAARSADDDPRAAPRSPPRAPPRARRASPTRTAPRPGPRPSRRRATSTASSTARCARPPAATGRRRSPC